MMKPKWTVARGAGVLLAVATLMVSGAASARTILFVGNSFTYGELSPVRAFHPELVNDLNGTGIGGVPALFATFAKESGDDWRVVLETSPGTGLPFHYANKRDEIAGRWDVVILQGYSTLSREHPGDPAEHVAAAGQLAALFRKANKNVRIDLVTSWSRADQTYLPTGHWYGQPISAMSRDIAAANALAVAGGLGIEGAVPVGQAWNRAMEEGVADPNPYDGVAYGKLDLWTTDQYHASAYGYYLEALVIFGAITGRDPRSLGDRERAGAELGFSPAISAALQKVAAEELLADGTVTGAR